jgi:hypothetical protein
VNDFYISSLSSSLDATVVKMFAQDFLIQRRKRFPLSVDEQLRLRTLPDKPSMYPDCLKLIPGVQVMILD